MKDNSVSQKNQAVKNPYLIGMNLRMHPASGGSSSLMIMDWDGKETPVIVQFKSRNETQEDRYTVGVNYYLFSRAKYLIVLFGEINLVFMIPINVLETWRTQSSNPRYANERQWLVDFHPKDHLLRPQGSKKHYDISKFDVRQQMV